MDMGICPLEWPKQLAFNTFSEDILKFFTFFDYFCTEFGLGMHLHQQFNI